MRALGIDFGERRIGLAISDPEGRLAVPLTTLERDTDRRAVYRIAAIARRDGVELLVLGEPRDPRDGSAGAAAERVRRFGAKLERAARRPVRYVEETLTTVEAAGRLRQSGADGGAGRRDAMAAQILLQEALDEERALRERALAGAGEDSGCGD